MRPHPHNAIFARFHQREAAALYASADRRRHAADMMARHCSEPTAEAVLRDAAIHEQQRAAEYAAADRRLRGLEQ